MSKMVIEKVSCYDDTFDEVLWSVETTDDSNVATVRLGVGYFTEESWKEESKKIADAIVMVTSDAVSTEPQSSPWIPWDATFPCFTGPVEDCLVQVLYGDGDTYVSEAGSFDWAKQQEEDNTITAYRKVQVY